MSTDTRTAAVTAEDFAAVTTEDAAALVAMTQGMTRSRLAKAAARIGSADTEDAAQSAAILACGFRAQGMDLTEAAALGSYRACLSTLQDTGRSHETAIGILTDTDIDALPRIALPSTRSPERITRTTDTDRLGDALSSLSTEDPTAAQILAFTTYLPEDTTATNGSRHPVAMTALAALLGMTERQRKALGKTFPTYLAALEEHMTATLSRHAIRTHYGADKATKAAAAAAVERSTAAKGHGQYGRPRSIPRSGTASAVLYQHPTAAGIRLQVTPGPSTINPSTRDDLAPLTLIPADLAAYVLTQIDTFPTYGRSTEDAAADNYAAAQEPMGAVKKANTVKRKRDGAVGSPMTSGPARPRY